MISGRSLPVTGQSGPLYCPLGFEVPRRDGSITHVSSPTAVRDLGWQLVTPGEFGAAYDAGLSLRGCAVRFGMTRAQVEKGALTAPTSAKVEPGTDNSGQSHGYQTGRPHSGQCFAAPASTS
jgi:hypothetical protein